MSELTPERLASAKPILERYRAQLSAGIGFEARQLERELKECWGLSYQGVKSILSSVFEDEPRYRFVAAFYMQHSGPMGPAAEFKCDLADLYRIRRYDGDDRVEASKAFWERYLSADAVEHRRRTDEMRASGNTGKLAWELDRLKELTGEDY